MHHWEAIIQAPPQSAYDGASFLVHFAFPPDYDQQPPKVVFQTIPFHPNIDPDTGVPCMDVLDAEKAAWIPRVSLQTLLVMLQILLGNPVLDNPVNLAAADIFVSNFKQYQQIAIQCVDASRRVLEGKAPFDDFADQEQLVIDEALNRTRVLTLSSSPPQTKPVVKKKPAVSFDSYYATWSQLATTKTTVTQGSARVQASRQTTASTAIRIVSPPRRSLSKNPKSRKGIMSIPSAHPADDSDLDDEADELCKWSQDLAADD